MVRFVCGHGVIIACFTVSVMCNGRVSGTKTAGKRKVCLMCNDCLYAICVSNSATRHQIAHH